MSIRKLAMCIMMAVCTGILMTGCEDNDSDDSLSDTGSGTATVSGVLDSVSGSYVPAGVQGITVDLVQDGKTILRTVTEANGSFTFYGVPAGEFTLVFHVQGTELTRDISVGETSNVVLGKVRVSPTGAVLDVIEVESVVEVAVVVEAATPPPPPVALSSNAALATLTLEAGASTVLSLDLTPAFNTDTNNYAASAYNSQHWSLDSKIKVTANAADGGAAVTIDGTGVGNGGTHEVTIPSDANKIVKIVVTAEDASTTNTYSIEIVAQD